MPAIYRKYRPQNFQNLLGQEVVAQIIRNAAKSDRISHAYLFTALAAPENDDGAAYRQSGQLRKAPAGF